MPRVAVVESPMREITPLRYNRAMKTPTVPPASIAFAPISCRRPREFRRRFVALKSTSLRRLQYRIRAKLAAGWRTAGPMLDITDYGVGERVHCWSQALCHPLAA